MEDTDQLIQVKEKVTSFSNEDIYKVHILNERGDVQQIYVFAGTNQGFEKEASIFSDIEIAYHKSHETEIIYVDALLHLDDTIRNVKHKIVQELSQHNKKGGFSISVEELYLFSMSKKELDMVSLYKDITGEEEEREMTREMFFQYATNIHADPYEKLDEATLSKPVFGYDEWMALSDSASKEVFAPVGMKFQESFDFLFPTNPYKNQLWSELVRYQSHPQNPLLTMEKSLLLNYTASRDIMVCLAKPMLQYAEETHMDSEYVCELYFPLLFQKGIVSKNDLNEKALELASFSAKQYESSIAHKADIALLYREIYNSASKENPLSYIEKGIKQYKIKMMPSEEAVNFPLDLLFRHMHTTEKIPFIKYNPGARRENMYRIYSDSLSRDGQKVPKLDENIIMKLSREIGKQKQISLFVQGDANMVINVHNDSSLEFSGEFSSPVDILTLSTTIKNTVQPIIHDLNTILQPSGYHLHTFEELDDERVNHSLLHYQAVLPVTLKMDLKKQMVHLTPIFDVLSTDLSKGAEMRFKNIENYREMDARSSFIREMYDRTGSSDSVIQALMENFDITEEEAIISFNQFRSQYQLLKQRVVENPGFQTIFKMHPLKNQIEINMFDIQSFRYVQEIEMYLDVVLRMSQKPKSVTIAPSKLKKFKTKSVPKKEDIVETIVAPNKAVTELYQPLKFDDDENDENDEKNQEDGMGLDFDDMDYYDDYEEGDSPLEGGNSPLESLSPEETYQANIDGMPIKNPNPFFRRMVERDPALFVTEESGKFPLYSRACPSGDKRQPVMLTDEEKEKIDRTNPGSYGHAISYGSSKDKKHWYICPRYWCLKTNTSISEEDVKAGKCGAVIPRDATRVPPGAYVYEFNNPRFHMKDGEYVQHVPGFQKRENHPQGKCIPCCFAKSWNSNDQVKRREACKEEELGMKTKENDNETTKKKTQSYIMSAVSYPLPPQRLGFPPLALQLFFNMDAGLAVDPKNNASILPGKNALLRCGVEKSKNQSFLACFAYYYGLSQKKETPSIESMRKILANAIDLDRFVSYHNGNLVSTFRPKKKTSQRDIDTEKYKNTGFYQTISTQDQTQLAHLHTTIASYEAFLEFLNDEHSVIDHTYLWDFFCLAHPQLLQEATNLVILQVTDNDITERVQFICPSNAYSHTEFDEKNKTVILLKQDQFYEPIRMHQVRYRVINRKTNASIYELKLDDIYTKGKVMKKNKTVVHKLKEDEEIILDETILPKFDHQSSKHSLHEIKDMLRLIKDVQKQYCRPLPSMPKKYDFKQNILVSKLQELLKAHRYQMDSQVVNYKNKVIGLRVRKEEEQKWLFVPCYPSAMMSNIKVVYMDDPGLWLDYRETRDRLKTLKMASNGEIMSLPKIKIEEDGLVIGFLTETNQFVQINPPTQNIDNDGIPTVRHRGYANHPDKPSADKILMTEENEDEERLHVIRNVDMETQFYNMFRSLLRININKFEHRTIRKDIVDTIDDAYLGYRKKLQRVESSLRTLLEDKVRFEVMDKDVLDSISQVVACNKGTDNPSYCLLSDDGESITIFPKNHLLSDHDNDVIYFARMADELVRYSRTQLFMFHPKSYMNITDTEFRIDDNELFLLESRLTREYFKDLETYSTKYVQHIQYEQAQPNTSETKEVQHYTNKITLDEQRVSKSVEDEPKKNKKLQDYIVDCIIQRTSQAVVGNAKGRSWNKVFPPRAKEIFFENTITCTFIPLIHIYQETYFRPFSIADVKKSLWKGYSDLLKTDGMDHTIATVLRNQGKREIMQGNRDLESVIMDDTYFITDLDWWVFCSVAHLPVVLFSSTTLKQLALPSNWLILHRGSSRKYFFVRSSTTTPSSYHLIEEQYTFDDLNNTMFKDAERGKEEYKDHVLSLQDYLKNRVVITRKKK